MAPISLFLKFWKFLLDVVQKPERHQAIIFQKSTKIVSEIPPIHYGPHDKVVDLAEICRLRYSKWGGRWESFWDMGRFLIFCELLNSKLEISYFLKNFEMPNLGWCALTFYWGTFESSNYMESKEEVGLYLVRYSKFFEFEIFLKDFCQTNISVPIFKNRNTYICLAFFVKEKFQSQIFLNITPNRFLPPLSIPCN